MLDPAGLYEYVDVREKRIPLPPISGVGSLAKAWAEALVVWMPTADELNQVSVEQFIQALINSVHDDVMLKVERAFVMENRK